MQRDPGPLRVEFFRTKVLIGKSNGRDSGLLECSDFIVGVDNLETCFIH